MSSPTVLKATITTDGSCWPNDGTGGGGWAAIIRIEDRGQPIELSGPIPAPSSNNRAELTAILEGLKALPPEVPTVLIRSDSQYAINCLSVWHHSWARRGWTTAEGKPVQNRDLIEAVLAEMAKRAAVSYQWTRGHADDQDNLRCDNLAMAARQSLNR